MTISAPDSKVRIIKAYVRPNKLNDVRDSLERRLKELGREFGMIATEVRGHGTEQGFSAIYRGQLYNVLLLPKYEIEMAVPEGIGDEVRRVIIEAARTGEKGDGRITWQPADGFAAIRTFDGLHLDNISADAYYLITAVVRPNKVDDVKDALVGIGHFGMNVTEVRGHGHQKGHTAFYRGQEYNVSLLPKMQIQMVMQASKVLEAYDAILKAARTGEVGDGRIWLTLVDEYTRIRTGEVLYSNVPLNASEDILQRIIVRPNKVDDVQDALKKIPETENVGMTVTELRGSGHQKGHTAVYRKEEYRVSLIPKMQIDLVIPRYLSDVVQKAVINAARTGEVGDGKIWKYGVDEFARIRDGQRQAA